VTVLNSVSCAFADLTAALCSPSLTLKILVFSAKVVVAFSRVALALETISAYFVLISVKVFSALTDLVVYVAVSSGTILGCSVLKEACAAVHRVL
jgi:hypothetical protein